MAFVKKKIVSKLTTLEMEVALKDYLKSNKVVVPNVSWGMFSHECDLITLSKAGYATEIEIKISAGDLKKDASKRHGHKDRENKIKYLYFAIPEYLQHLIKFIPERAGVLLVRKYAGTKYLVWKVRGAQIQSDYKFSETQRVKLLELMHYRIWNLKKKLAKFESA